MGMHFPGGISLMNASGSSRLRKRLVLNFLSGGSLDPRITFTRASSATRVNASGLIETVSSNVARINYDPVTLAPKGLLIEEQRTNLLLRSQEFDNASWTKNSATITANAATAPDGTATADALIPSASSAPHSVLQNVTMSNDALGTLTVFAKPSGYNFLELLLGGTGWNGYVAFNLATGAVGTTASNSAVSVAARISGPYSGYYRCEIRCAPKAGTSINAAQIFVNNSIAPNDQTFTGDGTSGIYLWQADLQAGAFATSPIPTTSATATRAADVASITGTNFSDFYNQTEGTFVVEATPMYVAGTTGIFSANASAGPTSKRIDSRFDAASNALITSGGAGSAALTGAVGVVGTTQKRAVAYGVNSFAMSINGAAVSSDASGAVPVGVDRLLLGGLDSGSPYLNGHIRRLSYYPSRLSNALLVSLTT